MQKVYKVTEAISILIEKWAALVPFKSLPTLIVGLLNVIIIIEYTR